MMNSATFVSCRSPIVPPFVPRSGGPATLRAPGDIAQRAPAFIRRGPGLLNGPSHSSDLVHEVIQLGLDLIPNPPPGLRHVEPSPYATDDGSQEGCHQYSCSLVHVRLLNRGRIFVHSSTCWLELQSA